jgi:hypothetical protein
MTSNLASNEIAKHGLKLRKEARKVIEEREAKTAGNVIINKPLRPTQTGRDSATRREFSIFKNK